MTAIEICRTEALGGHVERCWTAPIPVAYNSCVTAIARSANGQQRERGWRRAGLTPCPFPISISCSRCRRDLRHCVPEQGQGVRTPIPSRAETLTTIAGDPKHLGAEIAHAVLHTWGRTSIIIPTSIASCRAAAVA